MKIVQRTDELEKRFGLETALNMIAAAGFDGYDFSAVSMLRDESIWNQENYRQHAEKIRETADGYGLNCYQAHAPFDSQNENEILRNRIIRAMEIAAILGAETIVVHPLQGLPYNKNVEKLYHMNMEFYRGLIPYCERFNIKVAIENMWREDPNRGVIIDSVCADPREFRQYIDDLKSEFITGCLDLGHCGLCGRQAYDVLENLGAERITCLHIHDNDYIHDSHTLPYTMSMDWDKICRVIADCGYSGHFTYEAEGFLRKYEDDFLPVALRYMYDTARYLVNKIEKYRGKA